MSPLKFLSLSRSLLIGKICQKLIFKEMTLSSQHREAAAAMHKSSTMLNGLAMAPWSTLSGNSLRRNEGLVGNSAIID